MNHQVGLAVIFYGNAGQLTTNEEQFRDLTRLLPSFRLLKYDFHKKDERERLFIDFQSGNIDIALKNAYGRGHEADIEAVLDAYQIPYFGSGSESTLIGTAKHLAKERFRRENLPVAQDVEVSKGLYDSNSEESLAAIKQQVGFPCIVKDSTGTDSRGITIVYGESELQRALSETMKTAEMVIVEHYIEQATEVTCLVIDIDRPVAIEPIQMSSGQSIITAAMKDAGTLSPIIPAALSSALIDRVKEVAMAAHRALDCQSFSRADILVKGDELYLLEVDVHPGFRAKSPTIAALAYDGFTLDTVFVQLYERMKNKE